MPEDNEQTDPKAAVFGSMQQSADSFSDRGARTRAAYKKGQHKELVTKLARDARKRFDEFAGETGESDGDDGTGGSEDGAVAEHEPRTESNVGRDPR